MNTVQALKILNLDEISSIEQIKIAYRKKVLELHPDKNTIEKDGQKFKIVTEAYHFLKSEGKQVNIISKNWKYTDTKTNQNQNFNQKKTQWGAPPGEKIPEEDWSKFTKEFEEENPGFWKEYERKFWEEYNATRTGGPKFHDFEKTKEPKVQPNLFIKVDQSLCIGCCSCETIAPDVFSVDKLSRMNPKSKVINQKGAGVNKIMNAAETCPTKAIIVEDEESKEKLYPF